MAMNGYTSGTQALQSRKVNHDPEPYLHPSHGRATYPHTGIGWVYDPRPDFDVLDNPILAGLREDGAEHAIMWLTTLYDQERWSTPEQIDHARRVLMKLAALNA